jgi:hypothetical protein
MSGVIRLHFLYKNNQAVTVSTDRHCTMPQQQPKNWLQKYDERGKGWEMQGLNRMMQMPTRQGKAWLSLGEYSQAA